MDLKYFLESLNSWITLCFVFPAILFIGCYFTLRLRFVQILKLRQSFSCLMNHDEKGEGTISRFGAISAVLAGNFGTGNISGMAVAVATGGPGALVWMWVMAFFGAVIQYASCILGVLYRRKTPENEYVGGPMYYLLYGLKAKWLAFSFALLTLFGSVTVGNFAQINSIVLPLEKLGLSSLFCSVVMAFLVAIVILGGIKRIAYFASYIVPIKAGLYLLTSLFIIILHADQIPASIGLMFRSAFDFSSVLGGVLGAGMVKALTTGFERGLFATDAGTGIVPILQSGACSKDPEMDGIATLLAPFVVMIVCTMTGLVLIVTGAWKVPGLQSTNMVTYAFTTGLGSSIGGWIVVAALLLFAYTTILAWAYCGEKALDFLVGSDKKKWFRYIYILLIPFGTMIQVSMIWTLADLAIAAMVLINLVGIFRLLQPVLNVYRRA